MEKACMSKVTRHLFINNIYLLIKTLQEGKLKPLITLRQQIFQYHPELEEQSDGTMQQAYFGFSSYRVLWSSYEKHLK